MHVEASFENSQIKIDVRVLHGPILRYYELCQKKGRRPVGGRALLGPPGVFESPCRADPAGLQSTSDAWCPVLEDDMVTPNYVQVGVSLQVDILTSYVLLLAEP